MKTCPKCGNTYEADLKFCPRDGSALRGPTGASLIDQVIAERYLVLRKLGEGGMGQVYLAEHVKMGRKSAIKVMSPTMANDTEAVSRFNREAAHASRINHPNVAAIYDFGETPDGIIYLAMEYVDGEPLTKILESGVTLGSARVSDITRQVALGLDAAHELGIIHRDLKPDNVMIARGRDGSDIVKVVDFGIAKAQIDGQKVTRTGLIVGTPEYMSPEQASGDELDGRSDNYALALVTFHMLTGTLPFPSATVQESLIQRLTDRPRTLSEVRRDAAWPPALQAVLDRALSRERKNRYPRAIDFANDLQHVLAASPSIAASNAPTAPLASIGEEDLLPTRVSRSPAGTAPTEVRPSMPRESRGASAASTGEILGAPPRRRVLHVAGAIATVLVLGAAALVVKGAMKPDVVARDSAFERMLASASDSSKRARKAPATVHQPGAGRDSTKGVPLSRGLETPPKPTAPVSTATTIEMRDSVPSVGDSAIPPELRVPRGRFRNGVLTAVQSRKVLDTASVLIEGMIARGDAKGLGVAVAA
ncbi:MAG: serine/threonine protein kinase, partial [Gemmatimonadota bacterium]|nr:serine/threonine protein kinase [Gemmatimonadota bacterium]